MHIFESLNDLPNDFGPTAVTIGKYDAVHLGHQSLLSGLVASARAQGLKSVVVTFKNHPFDVLRPGDSPRPIIGANQKNLHLAESGVDAVVYLEFDLRLAAMGAEEFVETILSSGLDAKVVMVGEGFRFGAGASGDCATLESLAAEYDYKFTAVPRFQLDGVVVSTSAIRSALDAGDIAAATRMLGRPHVTTGNVEHGLKIGRTIGFPTANISREAEGYLPLDGVYAGWLMVDGKRMPTAISIGINETFQAVPRLAEAFVIDRTGLDLYEKTVSLEYVQFIRPAAKFSGVDDLVAEIKRDLVKIRDILGIPQP